MLNLVIFTNQVIHNYTVTLVIQVNLGIMINLEKLVIFVFLLNIAILIIQLNLVNIQFF